MDFGYLAWPLNEKGWWKMGLPDGRTVSLSPMRRVICDVMHFSRQVPLITIERSMDLADVVAARHRLETRPSWFALFLKANAAVAMRHDELRQSFLTFPYTRLHQHACTVANLTIVRRVGDEDVVFMKLIRQPERRSVAEIDEEIRWARSAPIEEVDDLRRMLRMSRLPGFARRLLWWGAFHVSGAWRARCAGTFGVTAVGALGSSLLHVLSPLTTTLSYGPFQPDGSLIVRLFVDHRVFDGALAALALQELEQEMHGPILNDLNQSAAALKPFAGDGSTNESNSTRRAA